MKRFLVVIAIFGGVFSLSFAGSFEKTFEKTLSEELGANAKVLSSDKLKSIPGLRLVILEDSINGIYPFYATEKGDSFIQVTGLFHFNEKSDKEIFEKRVAEMEKMNNVLKSSKIDSLFDELPEESFVMMNTRAKTGKLITIVTEPDCPYCREELKNIKEHLKTSNVRLVFASVHDETSFIKAQLILNETKLLSSFDADGIISIVEKYYKNIELTDEQKATKYETVTHSTQAIFGSGLVKGVPFIHEGTIK